jgi:hypothetical protein
MSTLIRPSELRSRSSDPWWSSTQTLWADCLSSWLPPITGWNSKFVQNLWHVKIDPEKTNGLSKPSAIDVLQLRGIDVQRFIRIVGRVSSIQMDEITAAIAAVIEYQ